MRVDFSAELWYIIQSFACLKSFRYAVASKKMHGVRLFRSKTFRKRAADRFRTVFNANPAGLRRGFRPFPDNAGTRYGSLAVQLDIQTKLRHAAVSDEQNALR